MIETKKEIWEGQQPSRKKNNVWDVVIQVLVAILTALSGVFTGCQIAS